jgi:siderophore synthetase component
MCARVRARALVFVCTRTLHSAYRRKDCQGVLKVLGWRCGDYVRPAAADGDGRARLRANGRVEDLLHHVIHPILLDD